MKFVWNIILFFWQSNFVPFQGNRQSDITSWDYVTFPPVGMSPNLSCITSRSNSLSLSLSICWDASVGTPQMFFGTSRRQRGYKYLVWFNFVEIYGWE